MIVIVSENTDGSTTEVLKWLKHYGYQDCTTRINIEDRVYLDELNLTEDRLVIEHKSRKIDLTNEASVIWFRRGNIVLSLRNHERKKHHRKLFKKEESNEEIRTHLKYEARELIEAINAPANTKIIGGFGKGSVNKLQVLAKAKAVGLDIPYTAVVDQRSHVETLKNQQKDIITKGISDTLSFENDRIGYIVYTNSLEEEVISNMPDSFFPSLIQGNVAKQIELRVFYWMGKIWSMAIFSQLDEQTSTDFRIYNRKKPNRMVPFELPKNVAEKVDRLMKAIELETGSIDFILDQNGKYVFLEVNPVGQFGMVSVPCSYRLEQEIARTLINYEERFQSNSSTRQDVVAAHV